MKIDPQSLKKALDALNAGQVILYPTDTVWGLGCDATNEEAVSRVFKIKQRLDSKALIVLVDSVMKLEGYVVNMPEVAYDLIEVSDKPLTIIYDEVRHLAPNLVAQDGSVAIRVTHEAFSQYLCQRFKRPIVSTSANISGQPTPRCFAEISDEIKASVDYVVPFRQDDLTPSQPSSIIKLGMTGEIKIIRS